MAAAAPRSSSAGAPAALPVKPPPDLNLRHLRAFVAVAETGRFTRAAERLGLAQSSVSESVAILERTLDLRLFDRHTRALKLSQAGAELLPRVLRLLADCDEVLFSSREIAALERGQVHVAAPTLQSALWLPGLVRDFARDFPQVRVTVHDVAEQEIHRLVRAGEVDIGLVTVHGKFPGDLRARPFYSDTYMLVLYPEHPLVNKREITWADVAKQTLIAPLPNNPVREALDAALGERGVTLKYVHEVSLPWTMLGLVQARQGVTVLTDAVREAARWMKLVPKPIHRPWMRRDMALITRRDRALTPAAQKFFERVVATRR
jgi:LysR family carnitine catabolism transcriptional activator